MGASLQERQVLQAISFAELSNDVFLALQCGWTELNVAF